MKALAWVVLVGSVLVLFLEVSSIPAQGYVDLIGCTLMIWVLLCLILAVGVLRKARNNE